MKYESCEGEEPGGIHVIYKVSLNGEAIYVGGESYMDIFCVMKFATDFYYEYVKPACVDI